jgi:hypothetical protein
MDITPARIRLSISNQPPLELRVGSRMRQDADAGWQLADASSVAATSGSSSTPSTGSAGGTAGSTGNAAEDEILKRLMKKREQESQ